MSPKRALKTSAVTTTVLTVRFDSFVTLLQLKLAFADNRRIQRHGLIAAASDTVRSQPMKGFEMAE